MARKRDVRPLFSVSADAGEMIISFLDELQWIYLLRSRHHPGWGKVGGAKDLLKRVKKYEKTLVAGYMILTRVVKCKNHRETEDKIKNIFASRGCWIHPEDFPKECRNGELVIPGGEEWCDLALACVKFLPEDFTKEERAIICPLMLVFSELHGYWKTNWHWRCAQHSDLAHRIRITHDDDVVKKFKRFVELFESGKKENLTIKGVPENWESEITFISDAARRYVETVDDPYQVRLKILRTPEEIA